MERDGCLGLGPGRIRVRWDKLSNLKHNLVRIIAEKKTGGGLDGPEPKHMQYG